MIIVLYSLLVVSVFQTLKCTNSLIVKMREEPDRKQSKKRRFKTFKNGNFWQQDITPDGKSFITESKPIF